MATRVAIIVFPNVMASAVTGPLDIFTTANILMGEERFLVEVRSLRPGLASTSCGIELAVRRGLPRAQQHLVFVPGLAVSQRRGAVESVVERATGFPRVGAWLRRQHAGGALISAGCAATFVLAEAGLLRGRTATTTWWLGEAFTRRYPETELDCDAILVESEGVLTGGAAMSYLDLSLHLVARFAGHEIAQRCAKYLVLDQRRASQAAYMIPEHVRADDPVVRRAAARLRDDPGAPLSAIAAELGTTPRTLSRTFQRVLGCSPGAYRKRARLDHARSLLEGRLTVEQVAARVGYADPSAFYRAFVKHVGMSPGHYQRRFAPQRPRRR